MGPESKARPLRKLTVKEILDRWPMAMWVFLDYNMACVGCDMAPFDTVEDVAHNYHMPVEELVHRIEASINGQMTSQEEA